MNTQTPPEPADELITKWLRDALAHAKRNGKNQVRVASEARINRTSLSKALKGERAKGGRKITAPEVMRISQVTGFPWAGNLPLADVGIMTDFIMLKMPAAAGIWREEGKVVSYGSLKVREFYEPAYEGLEQYARLVEDTHADLFAPSGFHVICVDYSDANTSRKDGDIVIVERLRENIEGPNLVEVTIRELNRRDGKWFLDSLCSDPDRFKPIPYDGDTNSIRISGLVLGAYRPARARV